MFPRIDIAQILLTLPGILLAFTFHEYAHAYMATKFGDPTPRSQGRLTANPLVHIDIIGFLFIVLFGFGWAKPVHTNPSYYRGNIRKKDMLVSLAGPAANLIIAIVCAIIYTVLIKVGVLNFYSSKSSNIILMMLSYAIDINCVLFVFNLLPIPPLDGFHILVDILPQSAYNIVYTLERYSTLILMVFVILPVSRQIIMFLSSYVLWLIFLPLSLL